MNTYTIKTDKAYFVASERVFEHSLRGHKICFICLYSVFAGNFSGIRRRDLEKKVNSIFLPIQNTVLSKSEF